MEGVGARFGRSSTRYGPATVFSGPVRKWKKRWIHVSPSPASAITSNHNHGSSSGIVINNSGTTGNGNNGSHLLLYKWTPLIHSNHKDAAASSSNPNSNSNSNNNNNNNNNKAAGNANAHAHAHANPDETDARHQQPPKRKFKYIPVYLIEQQKKEAEENEEQVDDEAKLSDNDPKAAELILKNDGLDEKPDINDVPMEENQDDNQVVQQDLNESTLDLSLGLKSHDGDSDSMADQSRDGQ